MRTFEEFATARLRTLLRLAGAISMDAALAEDLVQDVLIKVMRRWQYVSTRADLEPYVNRMLINEYLSWRRKWSRISPRIDVEPDAVEPDHAELHAERNALQAQIRRLPRRQQVVLALRFYADMSDAEIAEAMGCSPGTVRGYAARAISSLRLRLVPEQDLKGRLT
jgi:RNA polymerase sigma-70 factor (sigma-E family)